MIVAMHIRHCKIPKFQILQIVTNQRLIKSLITLQTMKTSRQESKNRKGKNYANIDVFSDSDCQAKSSQSLEKKSRKTHSIGRFRYSSKNSSAF